jgi:hypothetical protein
MKLDLTQEYVENLREEYRHTLLNRIILETECELTKGDGTIPENEKQGLQEKLRSCLKNELLLKMRITAAECRMAQVRYHEEIIPIEFSFLLPERLAS